MSRGLRGVGKGSGQWYVCWLHCRSSCL